MASDQSSGPLSKGALWTGRIISGVVALLLLMAGVMDLIQPPSVMEGMVKYGYPVGSVMGIGLALLAGVVLYVVPRTSVLGAIVLTGYLGGAVATHVRAGDPAWRVLIPLIFGLLTWGGLHLRDERLRTHLPLVRRR
jgi:hypothetical protein